MPKNEIYIEFISRIFEIKKGNITAESITSQKLFISLTEEDIQECSEYINNKMIINALKMSESLRGKETYRQG